MIMFLNYFMFLLLFFQTTLCYTLFSHHLKLDHYEKAYDAMVSNPDKSRRKDSLRQFVVTLFERKQFKQLAYFPYIDMFEDLEQIIESRARSVDLSVNNYYDFLYSFHVSKVKHFRTSLQLMVIFLEFGTNINPKVISRNLKFYNGINYKMQISI